MTKPESFGFPPRGMWSDPQVKEADNYKIVRELGERLAPVSPTRMSLYKALKQAFQDIDEKVIHRVMNELIQEKKADFDTKIIKKKKLDPLPPFPTNATYSADWLVAYPEEYFIGKELDVTADYGFFDGPVDLGKNPSGDFPSVTWMPRGAEDKDAEPNEATAAKDILPLKTQQEITSTYGPEYNTAAHLYLSAIKPGRKPDEALSYTLTELEKMHRPINKNKLLKIIDLYLRGLE